MEPPEKSSVAAGIVTEARLIEIVFPGQTNHLGTLFGGQALALMDGQRTLATRGRFVFVALDSNGKPTPVVPLASPCP